MNHPWESRAGFRRQLMVKPDISAKEIIGLLDEIGFVEKLFWTLPPGILLSFGSTTGALADRFGYPGRHWGIAIEDSVELQRITANSASRCIYFVGDVISSGNARKLEQVLASSKVPVVDVLGELYPTWCAARGKKGRSKDNPATMAAIICPARSGSTLLSNLLTNTGQIGAVSENLRHHVVALTRTGAINFPQWWSRIIESGTGDNGIFVSKIIHAFLAGALESQDQNARRGLLAQTRNWKLITIKREDVVERAVSVFLAEKTGTWQVYNKADVLRLEAKAKTVEYDFEKLKRIYLRLQRYDELAEIFVSESGGADLELSFDDIISDGANCALRVVDMLGLNRTLAEKNLAHIARVPSSSRTGQNERFARKFRAQIQQADT